MKTQILVLTHGNLAKELVAEASKVEAADRPLSALGFLEEQSLPSFEKELREKMLGFAPEDRVVILTDLFGGTPSNLAIPYIQRGKVEVITGVNLAVLMYLLTQPEVQDFEELCKSAKQAGMDAIFLAGEYL